MIVNDEPAFIASHPLGWPVVQAAVAALNPLESIVHQRRGTSSQPPLLPTPHQLDRL